MCVPLRRERLHREQQTGEGDGQNTWIGLLGLNIPAQSISPSSRDILDRHAPGFCQSKTNVVPVVLELNTGLLRRDVSEDVVLSTLEHTLEHSEVRDDATSVEVFGTVEDQLVTLGLDLQVIVTRVNGAADEKVLGDDQLLDPLGLLRRANNMRCAGPQKMVSKKHANGSTTVSGADTM